MELFQRQLKKTQPIGFPEDRQLPKKNRKNIIISFKKILAENLNV